MTLTVGSVCSGIGAPECAWTDLGWHFLWQAEVDAAASRVLTAHYGPVPNLGDMTTLPGRVRSGEVEAPDVLVGGTPCQSFSVAGLRGGMTDSRGNLALAFVDLANAIDSIRRAAGRPPCWILWENVPGVFSDAGNAFGCILGGLVGHSRAVPAGQDGGWDGAGVVDGPDRCAAWRVLDAQHFGVAQRRRRVFVLALGGAGRWACADALQPLIEGVHWHPAPSRKAGQNAAHSLTAGAGAGGGAGRYDPSSEDLIPVSDTLRSHPWPGSNSVGTIVPVLAFDGQNCLPCPDVAATLDSGSAHGNRGMHVATLRGISDYGDGLPSLRAKGGDAAGGSEALITAPVSVALRGRDGGGAIKVGDEKAFTLRASTGGGDKPHVLAFDTTQITSVTNRSNPQPGDPCHTLPAAGHAPAVAFTDERVTGTIDAAAGRSRGAGTNPGMLAIAFNSREDTCVTKDVTGTLAASSPQAQSVLEGYAVRRLMPQECEILQGFPPGYTAVNRQADGPRYKQIGNSMAVPVLRYIGERIAALQALRHNSLGAWR